MSDTAYNVGVYKNILLYNRFKGHIRLTLIRDRSSNDKLGIYQMVTETAWPACMATQT